MNNSGNVVMAVAGIGGYARGVTDVVLEYGPIVDPPVRLVAVCDPAAAGSQHAERVAELRASGVRVHSGLDTMLADADIEAVWLPVPISLHEPFTRQVLASGKAVMCEKPAAGTVDEVDAMIEARDRAGLPALIGFQSIYELTAAEIKRRILDGAIGAVRQAVVHGYWPRGEQYFARTDWAGLLRHRGRWVLDSPLQNAMAHYVNLPLFLLGPSFQSSAAPQAIEAELYRAAPIENYDTISARIWLGRSEDGGAWVKTGPVEDVRRQGIPLLVLLTHAASGAAGGPWVRIEGEKGTVTWSAREGAVIQAPAGREELAANHARRSHEVQSFARVVRGQSIEPLAVSTLETARAHTLTVNGASESAPVANVPEAAIEQVTDEQGDVFHTIRDIRATFDRCAESGIMLHESGACDFTYPPTLYDLRGYDHFAGPHPQTLAAARSSDAPATK